MDWQSTLLVIYSEISQLFETICAFSLVVPDVLGQVVSSPLKVVQGWSRVAARTD